MGSLSLNMAVSVAMFRDFKWSNGMWEPSENDFPLKIGIESSKSSRKSTLSMPKDPRQRRTPSLQSHWRASSGCFFRGGRLAALCLSQKKIDLLGEWENIFISGIIPKNCMIHVGRNHPRDSKKILWNHEAGFLGWLSKMRWEPAEKWGDIWCHPRMRV